MIELRVLIADDEVLAQDLLEEVVKEAVPKGYTLVCERYANGREAYIAWCKKPKAYAFVVSDGNMPGMNGAEFVKKIKSEKPSQKVIFCSGTEDFQEQADANFAKPIDLSKMIAAMNRFFKDYLQDSSAIP